MLKPFPCIFDVALDLTARGVWSLRAGGNSAPPTPSFPSFLTVDSVALPGCSQLDLFALMFFPVWALG